VIDNILPFPLQTRVGINTNNNIEIAGWATVRTGISSVDYSKACAGFNPRWYAKGNISGMFYLALTITLQAGLLYNFPFPFAFRADSFV
jgi:hypothetical protein